VSLAQIRTAILGTVNSVPNVGVVTEFEPAVVREEDLNTYFLDPDLGYILGWSLTRESTACRDATILSDFEEHQLVLRAYRAVNNAGASEKQLQDLVEAVRAAIRAEEAGCWNGLVQFVGHPQVRIFESRLFGQILVHYCELTLLVTEHVTVP
jgi:hypothetical protein